MIDYSNDETNFPHKSFLTDTQISRFCKAFSNNSSISIKLSKSQILEMVQIGGFVLNSTAVVRFLEKEIVKNILNQEKAF